MLAQARVMLFRSVSLVLLEEIVRICLRKFHHMAITRHFRHDGREHDGGNERISADDGFLGVLGRRAKRAVEPDLAFPF